VVVQGRDRKQDDLSDKSILGEAEHSDNIVITSEVRVDYLPGDERSHDKTEGRALG
jgi:hypothetical protein